MKDYAIQQGLVKKVDTSDSLFKGWFGLRKMFRDYLKDLNVNFYDECCPTASTGFSPVRYNNTTSTLERFNGTAWVAVV